MSQDMDFKVVDLYHAVSKKGFAILLTGKKPFNFTDNVFLFSQFSVTSLDLQRDVLWILL